MPRSTIFSLVLFVALFLSGIFAYGQTSYTSENNRFTVDYIRGCTGLEVQVNNTSGVDPGDAAIVYKFDYIPGDPLDININQPNNPDTIYTEPGVYKILQIIAGETGRETQLDSIEIEVREPELPNYRVYNCANNLVYIDFSEEDYYDQLRIDFGDGSPSRIVNVNSQTTAYPYPATDEYTVSVTGILSDAPAESCNASQRNTTITTVQQLAAATLTQVAVENESTINIEFDGADNVTYSIDVVQNGEDFSQATSYEVSGNSSTYTISDLANTRENYYCFRIRPINRCNTIPQPVSATVCSIALQAEAGELQNELEWVTSNDAFAGGYQVFDRNAGIDGTVLTNTPGNAYTHENVVCQQLYAYQVVGQVGDAVSLSEVIQLEGFTSAVSPALQEFVLATEDLSFQLNWQDTPEAAQYYIYRSDDGQASILIDSVADLAAYADAQVQRGVQYCYQVTYEDGCGNEAELSESLCGRLPDQGTIVFPNAFTPNGDGLNDIFVYKGNLIETVELQIFNRWGELIFQTRELDEGWDGNFRGNPAPQGSYFYRANVTDELGNQFRREGTFMLLP